MAQRWVSNSDVIATDLDNELVILNPATRALFTLNETGRVVWMGIVESTPLDTIVSNVVSEFAVEPEQARADITRLIDDLIAADLARPA